MPGRLLQDYGRRDVQGCRGELWVDVPRQVRWQYDGLGQAELPSHRRTTYLSHLGNFPPLLLAQGRHLGQADRLRVPNGI